MKHTELPFRLMKDGFASKGLWSAPTVYATDYELRYVAVCACADTLNFHSATDNLSNAEFIVKACNNHYELLEALKDLISVTKGVKGIAIVKENAEEAIKKAEQ